MKIPLSHLTMLYTVKDINRNNAINYEFKELTNDDMRLRKLYCVQVFKHFTQRFVKQY